LPAGACRGHGTSFHHFSTGQLVMSGSSWIFQAARFRWLSVSRAALGSEVT
jgi:hypothetical protein